MKLPFSVRASTTFSLKRWKEVVDFLAIEKGGSKPSVRLDCPIRAPFMSGRPELLGVCWSFDAIHKTSPWMLGLSSVDEMARFTSNGDGSPILWWLGSIKGSHNKG